MNQSTDTTRTIEAAKTPEIATDKKLISPSEKLLKRMQEQNDIVLNDLHSAGWIRASEIVDDAASDAKLYAGATTRRFATLLLTKSAPPKLIIEHWIKPLYRTPPTTPLQPTPTVKLTNEADGIDANNETARMHNEMLDIARAQVIGAAAGARLAALDAKKPMSHYMSKINETIAAAYQRDLVEGIKRLRDLELSPPAAHASISKTPNDFARTAAFDALLKSICDHDEEIGDDSADDLAAVCATWGDDLVIVPHNAADADDTDIITVADAYNAYRDQAK